MVAVPRHSAALAANIAGEMRAEEGDAKACSKSGVRGVRVLSTEYRCWFVLSISFHVWMWGYTAYKSTHWHKLESDGRMYVHGMQPGWVFGIRQDLSDPQWKTLRKFLPLIAAGIPLHASLSLGAKRLEAALPGSHVYFYCLSNIGFIIFLHGGKSIWPLLIAGVTYWIGKVWKGSRLNPVLTWVFCVAMVVASDYLRGFQTWSWLGTPLWFLERWGSGVYAWQTQFNLTMLRLISFNMERYWVNNNTRDGGGSRSIGVEERAAGVDKDVMMQALAERGGGDAKAGAAGGGRGALAMTCDDDYSCLHLIAYVFYIPLYIAGPIMTFPAWLDNTRHPQTSVSRSKLAAMLLQVGAYVLCIELLLHVYMYVSINNHRSWDLVLKYLPSGLKISDFDILVPEARSNL